VTSFVVRRIVTMLVTIWVVVTAVFLFVRVVPADPARQAAGESATEAQVEEIRHLLGFDQPIFVQYRDYVADLVHGDLGISVTSRRDVAEDVGAYLPATLELVLIAFAAYVTLSIAAGVLAATTRRRSVEVSVRFGAIAGMAIPVFWLAVMLQVIFFAWLGVLPLDGRLDIGAAPPPKVSGFYTLDSLLAGRWGTFWDAVRHLLLPVTALVLSLAALGTRMTRATMLRELDSDYVRFARAKGMPERTVVVKHALRNALNPVITLMGMQFGFLLGGTVLVEVIFSWPGIGLYAFRSFESFDYAPIQALALVSTIAFVLANFVVDLLYPVLDPRIRTAEAGA
jgi:peptide/nickel transport system permease protein